MRDALRLMAKVFAVVFGAGVALVVLGYLALGGLYIYNRIEAPKETAKQAILLSEPSNSFVPLYDRNGFIPDNLPKGQLDCGKPWLEASKICYVMIDGKIVGTISQQEAKDNLARWNTVNSKGDAFGPPQRLNDKSK